MIELLKRHPLEQATRRSRESEPETDNERTGEQPYRVDDADLCHEDPCEETGAVSGWWILPFAVLGLVCNYFIFVAIRNLLF